jgi:hypothetical protein
VAGIDRLAAFNTEALLALEAGVPDCTNAQDLLESRAFLVAATPIIIQELETAQGDHAREFARALAENLLAPGVLQSRRVATPTMTDAQHDVTKIHARTLVETMPLNGTDEGDMTALIEAAYLDCTFFVTTHEVLLTAARPLGLALIKICGMKTLYIVSPAELVAAWG